MKVWLSRGSFLSSICLAFFTNFGVHLKRGKRGKLILSRISNLVKIIKVHSC